MQKRTRSRPQTTIGLAFGKTLLEIREKAGLTQEEFAYRSGLERTYISLLERGRAEPSISTLIKIADFANISPVTLLEKTLKNK